MIIVSSWDYNEKVADIYLRHEIKTTFFCNTGGVLLTGFELGVRGGIDWAADIKKQLEDRGHVVKGYAGKADTNLVKSIGFSYARVGTRWQFSVEKLDLFNIPVHAETNSKYFWDMYSSQRDYFIFSGTGDCDEEWIIRMLGDGHEFIDMVTLSERLAVRKIPYS